MTDRRFILRSILIAPFAWFAGVLGGKAIKANSGGKEQIIVDRDWIWRQTNLKLPESKYRVTKWPCEDGHGFWMTYESLTPVAVKAWTVGYTK